MWHFFIDHTGIAKFTPETLNRNIVLPLDKYSLKTCHIPHCSKCQKHFKVKVVQPCMTLCSPMDYSLPGSSLHGILQASILEWLAVSSSRGSSQPRDQTQVSCIAGGFFTVWATREAQEYWMGSLFLLQRIFLTQELNQGLLHCRLILYQLSYQGSHPLPLATNKQTNKQKASPCRKLKVRKWRLVVIQSSLHDLMSYKWSLCSVYPFNDSSSLHPILFQVVHLLWHYTSISLIHPSF